MAYQLKNYYPDSYYNRLLELELEGDDYYGSIPRGVEDCTIISLPPDDPRYAEKVVYSESLCDNEPYEFHSRDFVDSQHKKEGTVGLSQRLTNHMWHAPTTHDFIRNIDLEFEFMLPLIRSHYPNVPEFWPGTTIPIYKDAPGPTPQSIEEGLDPGAKRTFIQRLFSYWKYWLWRQSF